MGGEFIKLAFRIEILIFEIQNFEIFAGGSDEPVLSIHLPDTAHGSHLDPCYHLGDHRDGIEILSGLCQKVCTPS